MSVRTIIYNALIISGIYLGERKLVIFLLRTCLLSFAQLLSRDFPRQLSRKIHILQFSFMLSLLEELPRYVTQRWRSMFKSLDFVSVYRMVSCTDARYRRTLFFNRRFSRALETSAFPGISFCAIFMLLTSTYWEISYNDKYALLREVRETERERERERERENMSRKQRRLFCIRFIIYPRILFTYTYYPLYASFLDTRIVCCVLYPIPFIFER